MERPRFATRAEYGAIFTNLDYWRPAIDTICERHGLPTSPIVAGLPGTNVVFIIGDQYAVKIYPDLFDGARSMPAERACYSLIARAGVIPAPALVAEGALFDQVSGWPWPYLVMTRLPGRSLGEEESVGAADMRALAGWLASVMAQLHQLPLGETPALRPDWRPFEALLQAQRQAVVRHHEQAQILPPHLIAQLEAYLPEASALIDRSHAPYLIHADLNADHVLGEWSAGRWRPSGIIDFGDVRVGDRAYDLVALHLGLFRADKRLLRIFLDAYPDPALRRALPQRAMAMTLLHEFNVLDELKQQIAKVATLVELADRIWDLDAPGLTA
jgi:hygromycin-B 7''-O-kinase